MCVYRCKESRLVKEKNDQVSNYMWQIIRYYEEGSALERNIFLYFFPKLGKKLSLLNFKLCSLNYLIKYVYIILSQQ